ncbi:YcjF family protein [Bradyrhizobium sp. HKCCYLS2038]|uniref:YcjF family protein n=1 Tax=unclassified Bradyrhizobium TaxID=2631580 RepID=UPI003EB8D76D
MDAKREAESQTIDNPPTDAERDEMAAALVSRFSKWSAAAGVIPLPIVDMVAVGGIQLQMLRRLAEIYDVPFSDNRGKSVIASLAGSIIPVGAGAAAATGLLSALKVVPPLGMTLAAVTMPAVSGAATYVIGKVFIQHFASGGTLLDFNPGDYREFIKKQTSSASTAGSDL